MTHSALCFVCGEPGGTHLICRELHKSQKELSEINNGGKTLRDEFAMAALQYIAIIDCGHIVARHCGPDVGFRWIQDAERAYRMADAMLEARKAKGE